MLRDRVSVMQAVDLALKYCKAKTQWVDHVYDSFIKFYKSKEEKNRVTRIVLGIKSKTSSAKAAKYQNFVFHDTIDWDNLDKDEILYWTAVEEWVVWFQENIAYIEQDIKQGYTDDWIESKFGLQNNKGLVEYIRKNI